MITHFPSRSDLDSLQVKIEIGNLNKLTDYIFAWFREAWKNLRNSRKLIRFRENFLPYAINILAYDSLPTGRFAAW